MYNFEFNKFNIEFIPDNLLIGVNCWHGNSDPDGNGQDSLIIEIGIGFLIISVLI